MFSQHDLGGVLPIFITICVAISLAWGLAAWANPNDPVHHDTADTSDPGFTEGVEGRVSTIHAHPIEGAWVQAVSRNPHGRPIPEVTILTKANGHYGWPLAPGTYDLTVVAEGYAPVTKRITVRAGYVESLNFVLQK